MNYNDVHIGKTAVQLLNRLGYKVIVPELVESGRTYLSKGLLTEAQKLAEENVKRLKSFANSTNQLIGIEPSAIYQRNVRSWSLALKAPFYENWMTK